MGPGARVRSDMLLKVAGVLESLLAHAAGEAGLAVRLLVRVQNANVGKFFAAYAARELLLAVHGLDVALERVLVVEDLVADSAFRAGLTSH